MLSTMTHIKFQSQYLSRCGRQHAEASHSKKVLSVIDIESIKICPDMRVIERDFDFTKFYNDEQPFTDQ